jgi:outer membrane lipoprotein-sorting protein
MRASRNQRTPWRVSISMVFALVLLLAGTASAATLDQVLSKMDQNAASFKSMSANVKQLSHTAVINEDNASQGTVKMKRAKGNPQFLAEFTQPDPKSVALSSSKAEIYYPKLNEVQEYDLGRGMVEKYLALGFGASGKEMQSDFGLKLLAEEPVNGQKTTHIEMIPKDARVLQQFPKIEMWISDATGYPVQTKMHQTGGDYMTVTYSDVRINPGIADSAYKLNLPKGVKRTRPGK